MYTGVTNYLERRVVEHQRKTKPGFTNFYNVHKLVFYEETDDVAAAIAREKQIKGWARKKKIALIEKDNPGWRDLAEDFGIDYGNE